MTVFLLDPANAGLAEGNGTYAVGNLASRIHILVAMARLFFMAGSLLVLAAGADYLYKTVSLNRRIHSVRAVTARVTGCAAPGYYKDIFVHYTVDGRTYDRSAFWRSSRFLGPAGLTELCSKPDGTASLQYLDTEPERWSVAPLTPLTRDEQDFNVNFALTAGGPATLFVAGVVGLLTLAARKDERRRQLLATQGFVLPATITGSHEDGGDSSYTIYCDYSFKDPVGVERTGRSYGCRPELKRIDFPAPGTPARIIYANNEVHEML